MTYRCDKGSKLEKCNQDLKITEGKIFNWMRLSWMQIIFIMHEFSVSTPNDKVNN